MWLFSHNSKL